MTSTIAGVTNVKGIIVASNAKADILLFNTHTSASPLVSGLHDYHVREVRANDITFGQHNAHTYDIIVIHGTPTVQQVLEIQRDYRSLPLIVITDNIDDPLRARLSTLDVTIIIDKDDSYQKLRENLALHADSHTQETDIPPNRLQSLSIFARYLNRIESLEAGLKTALDIFELSGLVIASKTDQPMIIMDADTRTLTELPGMIQAFDPFMQVIDSGNIQYYADISAHPYFVRLPMLAQVRSSIIVPVDDGTQIRAIGFFGKASVPLTADDLTIFEIVGDQLMQLQSGPVTLQDEPRHLLPLWQQLIDTSSARQIADITAKLISQHPKLNESIVWLDMHDSEPIVASASPEFARTFLRTMQMGFFLKTFDQFHNDLAPVIMWKSSAQNELELRLFQALKSECMIVIPIVDSARIMGLVLAGVKNNRFLDTADIILLQNEILVSGLALERLTLMSTFHQENENLSQLLNSNQDRASAHASTEKARKSMDTNTTPIIIGNLSINPATREVRLDNQPLDLTRIEYDILRYLVANANQIIEHNQLLSSIWGPEYRDEKHYLWVNISRLRKKLEPRPNSPRYIHNRPGIGYMLRAPSP